MCKEDKIKELEEKIKALQEEVQELKDSKDSKVWKPSNGEEYWFVDGGVGSFDFADDSEYDKTQHLIGNCYKTREEAEQALEIKKIDTELRRYALEHNQGEIDWEDFKQQKYSIYYDYEDKKFNVSWDRCTRDKNIYFTSEEIAKQAIETIGRERVEMWAKA